jgi:DNA-binding CsgD family transcriptional regulator
MTRRFILAVEDRPDREWPTPMGKPVADSRLDRLAEGQRIIARLIEAGHTNGTIARAIGCHGSTMSDYRNGTRAPTRDRLAQLRSLAEEDQP